MSKSAFDLISLIRVAFFLLREICQKNCHWKMALCPDNTDRTWSLWILSLSQTTVASGVSGGKANTMSQSWTCLSPRSSPPSSSYSMETPVTQLPPQREQFAARIFWRSSDDQTAGFFAGASLTLKIFMITHILKAELMVSFNYHMVEQNNISLDSF